MDRLVVMRSFVGVTKSQNFSQAARVLGSPVRLSRGTSQSSSEIWACAW
jgi:hypothetical protein